jgi:hypothetical protein
MKKFDIKKTKDNAINGVLVLGGMVLANMACNQIDKVINKDQDATETTDGVLGALGPKVKKAAAPLITIAGGLAISQFVDNKYAKSIGLGMIGMGGVKLIKGLTEKDLLAGDFDEPTAGVNGFGRFSLSGGEMDDALKMIDRNLVGLDSEVTGTQGIGNPNEPADYAGVYEMTGYGDFENHEQLQVA